MTTKIQALVDDLGMLARFSLTGGQANDTGEALPLLNIQIAIDAIRAAHASHLFLSPDKQG
ncbi:hypothetical protein CE195_02985, partial [Sodalis-like symbiont of Philaenus spumarius]